MYRLLIIIGLYMAGLSCASATWYSDPAPAKAACDARMPYNDPRGITYTTCVNVNFSDSRCKNSSAAYYIPWMSYWGYSQGFSVQQYACYTGFVACPSGQTRNSDGNCVAQCVAGQSTTTFVKTGGSSDSPTIFIGAGPETSIAGCNATCDNTGDYFRDSSGNQYIQASCTTTGQPSNNTESPSSTTITGQTSTSSKSTDGKTCATVGDATACVGGSVKAGCTEINGTESCPTSNNSSSIAGQTVNSTDSKNCIYQQGKSLCQVAPGSSESAICGSVNGIKTCYSFKPTINETTTVQTNPDGSTVKTTSKDSTVKGVQPVSTVTTTSPNGNVTTVIKGTPGDSTILNDIAKNAGGLKKADLATLEKNTGDTATNTKGLKDAFDAFAKSDQIGNSQDETHAVLGDHSTLDDAIASAPQTDIGALASPSSWWSLPDNQCYGAVDQYIFGYHFVLAPCDKLAPLREILAYFLYLTTAWQIFNIAFRTKEG